MLALDQVRFHVSTTPTISELQRVPPRTMDKLPQELIDKIIDSFDRTRPDGLAALLACSRVARAWRPQAQKKLLPHVYIWSVDHLKKWDRDIPLQSEVPSYVRYLNWALWPTTQEQPNPFLQGSFPDRFTSFSNIETLLVSNLSLQYFNTAAIQRTFSHLARVANP